MSLNLETTPSIDSITSIHTKAELAVYNLLQRVSTPLQRLEADVLSRYRLTGPSAPLRPLFRYLSLPLFRYLFLPYPRHPPISQVPEESACIYIKVGSDTSESRFHRVCFGVNICQGQPQYAVSINNCQDSQTSLLFACRVDGLYLNSGTTERQIQLQTGDRH